MKQLDFGYYWASSPFIRIIIPFILGILFHNEFNMDAIYYLIFTLIGSTLIHFHFSPYKKLNQGLFSVFIFISIFLLANQCALQRTTTGPNHDTAITSYQGHIISTNNHKNSTRILVDVQNIRGPTEESVLTNKVILRSKYTASELHPGDQILFRANLKPIATNKNPLTFDIASYWNRKGYYLSGYINLKEFLVTKSASETIIQRIRSRVRQIIDENFLYNSTKGVAKALLLGDKSGLDPEIKHTFMDAGAMHVLAVSGLHVGLVAVLFGLPLIPLSRIFPTYRRLLKLLVLIPVWIFAAICEFSPSVTRASIMISFYLIADAQAKPYLGINILALTALILLIYNPNYLYDVGFQLSFMAVLSLLLVYRQIRKIYYPKNKITKYFWELTCVTISVQIFLIPILFYNFHRFPIYFIPNSIVAVSSLTLIIFSGMAMIIFSWQSYFLDLFAWLFEHLILALNYILALNNKIPYNNIENIWISPLETFLLFAVSIGTALWLNTQRQQHIWLIIVPFILFTLSKSNRHHQERPLSHITSFSIPYHTGLEISSCQTMYSFSSSDSIHPFISDNLHSRLGIQKTIKLDINDSFSDQYIQSKSGIIFTPDKKIIILSKKNIHDILRLPKMKIDYLVLHGNLDSNLNAVLSRHQIDTIVKDCSSNVATLIIDSDAQIINTCDQGWTKYRL